MRSILVILLLIYAAPARAGSFADDFSRGFAQGNAARQQRLAQDGSQTLFETMQTMAKIQETDFKAIKSLSAMVDNLAAQVAHLQALCLQDHVNSNDSRLCVSVTAASK